MGIPCYGTGRINSECRMITLSATLLDEVRRAGHALDLVIHCVVTGNTRANAAVTRTITLCKASRPFCQDTTAAEEAKVIVPNLLSSVGSAAYEVDPIKRSTTVGQVSIEITDTGVGSEIRAWLAACYVNGAKVTLTWGAQGVPLTDFAPFGVYYITDYNVAPGLVTLETRDGSWVVEGKKTAGLWIAEHPAECALKNLQWCGVPAADIDTGSFAFDDVATKSHYNICKSGVRVTGSIGSIVTGAGAYAAAWGFDKWQIDGATALNTSAGGRLYPEITLTTMYVDGVSELAIVVNLYRGYGAGEVSMGTGTYIDVYHGDAGVCTLGPPRLIDDRGNWYTPAEAIHGGSVVITPSLWASPNPILRNAANYIIPISNTGVRSA
jgi:hypothetical protein